MDKQIWFEAAEALKTPPVSPRGGEKEEVGQVVLGALFAYGAAAAAAAASASSQEFASVRAAGLARLEEVSGSVWGQLNSLELIHLAGVGGRICSHCCRDCCARNKWRSADGRSNPIQSKLN